MLLFSIIQNNRLKQSTRVSVMVIGNLLLILISLDISDHVISSWIYDFCFLFVYWLSGMRHLATTLLLVNFRCSVKILWIDAWLFCFCFCFSLFVIIDLFDNRALSRNTQVQGGPEKVNWNKIKLTRHNMVEVFNLQHFNFFLKSICSH